MKADIITIGDEILIGQIIDTNSAWLAEKLNSNGISVRQITTISDESESIIGVLGESTGKSKLVLITGGLGPTRDDRTKGAICEFFETNLVHSETVLKDITELLSPQGIAINELNREQALVPAKATALPNRKGTAPGLCLEKDGTVFIFLPGVPLEMKTLVNEHVLPMICDRFRTTQIVHQTLLSYGLPESVLAEKIAGWESGLPNFVKLAYLPNPINIRLRLSAYGDDRKKIEEVLQEKVEQLKSVIPENFFGFEGDTMAGVVGRMLREKNKTVSTAESCTGGNIAHFFTSTPGSSGYFKGSIVAYSNEVKEAVLQVDKKILQSSGAVSEPVVKAMASSVRRLLKTDYSVAISGIAGPEGGTEEKPVGTAWIAIGTPETVISKKMVAGKERSKNIVKFTQTSLNMLRHVLMKK